LALSTRRYDLAAGVLRTFARFISQGMLPNRFPDSGEQPEYNTVDATLWYFHAIDRYTAASGDQSLARELLPALDDIIEWHLRGTRYHIHVDPADGLLFAGEPGVQLTWMDAKVGDWVVTPRIGKPVEINALWINALRVLARLHTELGMPAAQDFGELAEKATASFERFWYAAGGYLYDVIDGPDGSDAALRPNQLVAVSLPNAPVRGARARSIVDACARTLLTSHGLRSLAPDQTGYIGHYGGDQKQRDAAYHQGTVWGWLIGPFVDAYLQAYGRGADALAAARTFLTPFEQHLSDAGLGSISEIFAGDAPFAPAGCVAQAWSVSEVLRAWLETAPATRRVARRQPTS
jgi:predicted glycogen debranching enzyme